MKLNKKKKGFTLIELMAVIAIVAILAAVLVPTVSGYITRSKKTAVVTQVRTIVNAVESYNITASEPIGNTYQWNLTDKKIKTTLSGTGLLDDTKITSLHDDVPYSTLKSINEDTDSINKITIVDGKLTGWSGANTYTYTAPTK